MKYIIEFFNNSENELILRIVGSVLLFAILLFFKRKISRGVLGLVSKLFLKKNEKRINSVKNSLSKPLESLIAVIAISVFLIILAPYLNSYKLGIAILKIGGIITICWGLVNYLSDNLFILIHFGDNPDDKLDTTAIRFISNILKIVVICLGIVMVVSELGYNINGLLTGIGVGGLAVSLAAQDTIQSLISGFIIIFDKPFSVGDFIETSSIKGTVEDITMRSIRIRKLDDSIVIVPNSSISTNSVINHSKINKRLVDITIGLTYSTSIETLEKCKKEIKDYILNNEDFDNEVVRVTFSKLDDSSQNISIICYTKTNDIGEYSIIIDKLNFELKKIVERNNSSFAFPSKSIYIEKDN